MKHFLIAAVFAASSISGYCQTTQMQQPGTDQQVFRALAADATLKQTFARWASIAGLEMDWRAVGLDYPLTSRALALPETHDLVNAVKELSTVYAKVAVPLSVSIDKGTMIVGTAGSENRSSRVVETPAQLLLPDTIVGSNDTLQSTNARIASASKHADDSNARASNWKIAKGESISHAFNTWCVQNKSYILYWEAPELISQVDIDLQGTFENSVALVVEALNRATEGIPEKNGAGSGVQQNSAKLQVQFLRANTPKILRVMEK